jgi:hypothetical protein
MTFNIISKRVSEMQNLMLIGKKIYQHKNVRILWFSPFSINGHCYCVMFFACYSLQFNSNKV